MSGTPMGGFEYEVPRELMFPDFFKRAERGEDISPYTFSLVQPMQRITPEWSDTLAKYLEAVKKYGGSDYANGGAVEAPDYDYAAAKKAGVKPDKRGHMPDTYKLPNHMTFSDDSIYSNSETQGGRWAQGADGKWVFWPSEYNVRRHPVPEMEEYFRQVEPDSFAVYPSTYRLPSPRP
jgi:hypothetical protein